MDSSEEIELPDLLLGPIRYSIGTAFQVLRQGTREKVKARHPIQTTPRTSERYVVLSNDAKFGASVFWLREGMLPQSLIMDFFDVWQTRRDGKKRGMLEVVDDSQ